MSNKSISIAFFGTNDFSAKVLSNVLLDKNILVKYIVTKLDKKVGRGGVLTPNPLLDIATKHNIPVLQVTSLLKDPAQLNSIDFSKIDLGVVVSFAYILPYDILRQVKKGFINLHPSLLPKHRGPAPIHNSIINQPESLGATIMLLDEGMDTGPILSQQQIDIPSTLVYPQIEQILIEKGSKLLLETIKEYNEGRILPKPQDNSLATTTQFIKKRRRICDIRRKTYPYI